ncbi:uncharacterized protein RCO7_14129 [Rhynchosporium graminicola]|uniref:Uncharacterized protein n=2 Tax=Rhynchosporium TaxID=38037 RepID=A0A1E1M8S7_RHYSE|nr:uncharacterized protein RCO7_14129 [Rhynchosporium commune]CZT45506.1 uncharacterized protein RSE6_05822 [Rhynchosporium secalis]
MYFYYGFGIITFRELAQSLRESNVDLWIEGVNVITSRSLI